MNVRKAAWQQVRGMESPEQFDRWLAFMRREDWKIMTPCAVAVKFALMDRRG